VLGVTPIARDTLVCTRLSLYPRNSSCHFGGLACAKLLLVTTAAQQRGGHACKFREGRNGENLSDATPFVDDEERCPAHGLPVPPSSVSCNFATPCPHAATKVSLASSPQRPSNAPSKTSKQYVIYKQLRRFTPVVSTASCPLLILFAIALCHLN